MRHLLIQSVIFLCCSALMGGCMLIDHKQAEPGPPATVEIPQTAGPYWHQSGAQAGQADALAYYAAVAKLENDALALEKERLRQALAEAEDRLARLQLVLLAVLPGHPIEGGPERFLALLEEARQDTDLNDSLSDLFVLLDDQLHLWLADQQQQEQCRRELQANKKTVKSQASELAQARRENTALSEKLQKLQAIEQGLIDRERKK